MPLAAPADEPPSRPAIDVADVQAALARRGITRWHDVQVVGSTGSTNTDLVAAATAGAADGTVLLAEAQSTGRGRLDRGWSSPPGTGLLFSALIRPSVPPAEWGWLPLLTGVAVRSAVAEVSGVATGLKWPNDLLATSSLRKLCGVLLQAAIAPTPAAVIGVGLNVSTTDAELPTPTAGSLVTEGAVRPDRVELLVAVLDRLEQWLGRWQATGGNAQLSGLADEYRTHCLTLGTAVRVHLPGSTVDGTAVDLDPAGRLVVDTAQGRQTFGAGDIEHLRPA